jgi:hypothetical protein
MNIPNIPSTTLVRAEDGRIQPDWQFYFNQMQTELQINNSNEGTVIPSLDTAQIAQLTGPSTHNSFIVNSDTGDLMFNVNGVYKTVTLV